MCGHITYFIRWHYPLTKNVHPTFQLKICLRDNWTECYVNVMCLLSGLEFIKCSSEYQTGKTQIRLLPQKQSDLGLHCLSRPFWQATSVRNFWTFQLKICWMYNRRTDRYGKCSKILNSFLFLFSNKMLVIRTGIHKMLIKMSTREDLDQTASEAVWSGSALFT